MLIVFDSSWHGGLKISGVTVSAIIFLTSHCLFDEFLFVVL